MFVTVPVARTTAGVIASRWCWSGRWVAPRTPGVYFAGYRTVAFCLRVTNVTVTVTSKDTEPQQTTRREHDPRPQHHQPTCDTPISHHDCHGVTPGVNESLAAATPIRPRALAATGPGATTVPVKLRYVDGLLPDGELLPLMRLRYGGSANRWGIALYLASHDGYRDEVVPRGFTAGTPEEALDCAANLYLHTADEPPTNLRA